MLTLYTKTQNKIVVLPENTCDVFDPFDNLLDSSLPFFILCSTPSLHKNYQAEYIKGKCILLGSYGLKGGGQPVCKCFSSPSPEQISSSDIQGKIDNKNFITSSNQREIQHQISDSVELLKEGCDKSLLENLVEGINYLAKVKYQDFNNPLTVSLILLECLSAESMWEQVSWADLRKKIAKTARRLLSYSFYNTKNRVQIFAQTKDKVIPFANNIIDRVLEEEQNFPENSLLCEMKAILATIKVMKDSDRWFKALMKQGKNLYEVIFHYDATALKQLSLDFADFLITKVQHRMSIHLFCLDFIERQELLFQAEWLFNFLQEFKDAKWQILYAILEEIEGFLLNQEYPLAEREKIFNGVDDKVGIRHFAGFNGYTFVNNWRIREKVAVILVKLANLNDGLMEQVSDVMAERVVFETDIRVKDIFNNPSIIQASHDLIHTTWEIRKNRFEELLEEEKSILLNLEKKLQSSKDSEKAGILEIIQNQRSAFEKQVSELSSLIATLGKTADFLEKYESYTALFKREILSAIEESQMKLERNIDRKFSDVMRKLNCKSPRSELSGLCWMPNSVTYFVGRAKELEEINEYLETFKKKVCVLAIVGMGGIGKTQLVLEFASDKREYFGAMWFIAADSKMKIEAGFMDMAQALSIDSDLNKNDIIRRVLMSLSKQRLPWLLVYDGVVNPKDIESYTPGGRGMILITSRNPCWDLSINLQELDRKSSVKLLTMITKLRESESVYSLAEELGDLPLALCQAACFIKQTSSDFEEYLNIYKARTSSIIDLNENNENLVSSWRINLQQIEEINKNCKKWLDCLAYLSPSRIPDALAKEIFRNIENQDNLLGYKKIIKLALDYSLIEIDENKAISMHKLVQSFIRKLQKRENSHIEILENVFLSMFTTQKELEFNKSLVDHLEFFLSYTLSSSAEAGELYSRLGIYYLEVLKNVAMATKFIHCSLKIKVEKFGKTSLEAAQIYNNLGNVFFEESDLTQAIFYYRKAMMIKKRHLAPDALDLAYSYNNLGICFFQQASMSEAVNYILKAMEIMKSHLGEDDISITTTYMNLGMAYDELGQVDKAETYLNLAMQIRSNQLPENHPDIADCLLNLGILHCKTKQQQGIEEVKKAQKILEDALGSDNPATKNAKEHYLKLLRKSKVMIT